MKTIKLNIFFKGVLQKLSFEQIEKLIQGNFTNKKFYTKCKFNILRGENDVEKFARNFINTHHPDYSKNTFKLILEMGTAKLIKI